MKTILKIAALLALGVFLALTPTLFRSKPMRPSDYIGSDDTEF